MATWSFVAAITRSTLEESQDRGSRPLLQALKLYQTLQKHKYGMSSLRRKRHHQTPYHLIYSNCAAQQDTIYTSSSCRTGSIALQEWCSRG
jgi:hypothetical protein